tara:strand:+ start:882 stop:1040 length:159 start_codon:yes stop_codon:yes gene_type:complete
MSRMPCSITDDPYADASDYFEGEGVYAPYPEEEEDDKLTLNITLGPLIAPHE